MCSSAILILCFIIFVNGDVENVDYCIWGRAENTTTYVNGLYTYNAGTSLSYYEKIDEDCPANNLYLYKASGKWVITPVLTNNPPDWQVIAKCNSPQPSPLPTDCGNYWTFADENEPDASIDVYENECPNLDVCDEILAHYWSLEGDTDDCTGPFERWTGQEEEGGYEKYNNNPVLFDNCFYAPRIRGSTYLFFSPYDFRWICSNTTDDMTNGGQCRDYNNSATILNYQLDPAWFKFKQIKSINDYSWSFTEQETILIECTSSSPTKAPTLSPIVNYTLGEAELIELRDTIKTAIDNSGPTKPLLSASIRLAINDCMGAKEGNDDETIIYDDTPAYEYNTICDGCINFRDSFHDGLLLTAVEPLDDIYMNDNNDWAQKMSLADFWAAAATVAIEYAVALSDAETTFELPLYFGRQDCTDSPDIAINSTIPKDLDALFTFGFDDIIAFFANDLNFTTQETIAIMGVNGLGIRLLGDYEAMTTIFDGEFAINSDTFDNAYFTSLVDNEWISVDGISDSYWRQRGGTYSMLNTDITLAWDIDDLFNTSTNEYDCIVNKASNSLSSKPECSRRVFSTDIIDTYVYSNQVLLDDFAKLWTKLVTTGYDNSELRDDVFISTETPETTEADAAYRTEILYHTIISIFIVVTTIYCAINDEY